MMFYRFAGDSQTSRILRGWGICMVGISLLGGCNAPTTPPILTPTLVQATAQAIPLTTEATAQVPPQAQSATQEATLQATEKDTAALTVTPVPILRKTATARPATQTSEPMKTPSLSKQAIQQTLAASTLLVVITVKGANVRSCPDLTCELIKDVAAMEYVHVIATPGNWSEIMFEDGTTGFVSSLALVTPASPPVMDTSVTLAPTITDCAPPVNWVPYIVWAGETTSSIARRAGVTPQELATANCLPNINLIIAGQRLYVPVVLSPPPLTPTNTIYAPQPVTATFTLAPGRPVDPNATDTPTPIGYVPPPEPNLVINPVSAGTGIERTLTFTNFSANQTLSIELFGPVGKVTAFDVEIGEKGSGVSPLPTNTYEPGRYVVSVVGPNGPILQRNFEVQQP